ncbi:GNAT family N-acetyltransferase [Actinocorallia sp. A-T 12471]|uniref:GNAT family N-acetyltransferase n=1 Tax=Actinocorallia sp. A-T 12471 TaxID=3089813 RepID=UPI0029D3E55F|nr:GNAT family N-acetyltransferase [Actinocorallia sp. A-T 12471]MDX6741390.1 GNAT family N-acetyltransferase [Actinocorallia sp. A-T 12471]
MTDRTDGPGQARWAEPQDLAALPSVEASGDALFAAAGIVFPPGPTVIEELSESARVLVLGDPPVGFAALTTVDGLPYLEQISVHADHTGKGLGGVLLRAAIEESPSGLTLLTFRDIPWNGPWYRRFGFTDLPRAAWGPELRAHWAAETAAGLHALGPRLAMRRA